MERGLGQAASLETWASVSAAVGQQLVAFLEDVPGADRPRDYEHLKRQQLIIDTAARGGWRAIPDLPVDPGWTRSRSVDVLLEREATRESIVVEVWDFFDDVGAAIRGLDAKVATVRQGRALVEAVGSSPWRVGGLFVVRGTRRNRALVHEFGAVFRARFPGSAGGWIAALADPTRPLPPTMPCSGRTLPART